MLSLRWGLYLIAAPLGFFLAFFLTPLGFSAAESLRPYVPGMVGSSDEGGLTLENYRVLIEPVYLGYLAETFRISFIATMLTLLAAYPLATHIARRPSDLIRKVLIAGLVMLMFMSTLVKVYAITIALGPLGFGRPIAALFGTYLNSSAMSEIAVLFGLFSFLLPIGTLMLVATIQNINPRYLEASLALGANHLSSHLKVMLPLALPGLTSAFLVTFTLGISAFVIPMILGRGRVTFVTNLIYTRFSEISNYPSGAALSMLMLLLSLLMVYVIAGALNRLIGRQAGSAPAR
ncbi:ABC transporter permease [Acuticoccus sediminis]|uniref:ABC transporter permease n=1 Tax=Acuticoccus sediminis TaxID=2184697 RepID=A0A8B2NNV6_9HYPH|nr:ABC transporter permease subunit [Acuticoccus sediminis]RAI01576.1 ABC transporter permease [Acuticoccus sediminis]